MMTTDRFFLAIRGVAGHPDCEWFDINAWGYTPCTVTEKVELCHKHKPGVPDDYPFKRVVRVSITELRGV